MIRPFDGRAPRIAADAWVHPSAEVIGDVELAAGVSVWCHAVLRGDVGRLVLGEGSNLQDGCVVHCTGGRNTTRVGRDCTIGHRAILHGCTIGDRVLVGMGAIVMDDVVIEDEVIVGAGSLLTPGTRVPAGSLVLGAPARVRRALRDEEREQLARSAAHYRDLAARHRASYAAAGAGPDRG
ncbi:MAG: gamma carbonic anhydrase family protein [Planctomycetota bacterium]|nr:MAG: gamma carbonic anhydrase family protein [Planctomycetota bacterium]